MNNGEKLVDVFLEMIKPEQINIEQQVQSTTDKNKTTIILSVKKHPYYDDNVKIAEFDFEKCVIKFYEQHRLLFQNFIEKMYSGETDADRIRKYETHIVFKNECFASVRVLIDSLLKKMENANTIDILKQDFLKIMSILNFEYKPPIKADGETVQYLTDKLIKAIAVYYTESWICNHELLISFDKFERIVDNNKKKFVVILSKIRNNMSGYCYGKQVTEKMVSLINPDFLTSASLKFNLNSGSVHSATIILGNNPWRNGAIKGDMLFVKIKAEGKERYIYFKSSLSYLFDKSNISYTANNSEIKNGFIKIELDEFLALLNNCNDDLKYILQMTFLRAISFPEFGCCSKYTDCEKAGKCLHSDQLYATACQFQKLMKRTEWNVATE